MKKDNQQRPLFIYLRAINIKKMKIIIELKKDFMKLLNKLFEWLGYVPKVEFNESQYYREIYNKVDREIISATQLYVIRELDKCECYVVVLFCNVEVYFDKRIIKAFPFGDDKEYAKLCAEELCEKLNERI